MLIKNFVSSLAVFVLLGVSGGCYSNTPIELQNGASVDNCSDYNEARKQSKIKEQSRNVSISSEYLSCSLLPEVEPIVEAESILKLINRKLKVRSIPTSLGMSVGRKDTFEAAGAVLNADKQALEIVSDERNFKIFLKGRLNGKLLVWVVDELSQGAYRSYYPALLSVSEDEESVLVSSFYESGF